MAYVDVNPRYRALLDRQGLIAPADFLDLPGVLVGGHADRDIARVTVGEGPERFTAYLKREQHIRWRDRLGNAWAGFGLVSRSGREAQLLRQLRQANIGCPEVIAVGADRQGRAFLLVRELTGMVELRRFLGAAPAGSSERRQVAVCLGRALAAIHAAGFQHPDLYSKHVLVERDVARGAATFAFLDWQRAGRRRPTWARCWRELAALDATVADDLVTVRERLACLHAYCRSRLAPSPLVGEGGGGGAGACVPPTPTLPHQGGGSQRRLAHLAWAARAIRRQALRLLRRRRIREMRQPPLPADCHQLIQLTPSALWLTRQFRDELAGQMPSWLRFPADERRHVQRAVVPVAPARQVALVQRRTSRPLGWLWSWLRGRPLVSPEVAHAGTLFRLERYGIRTPRLLAFGQRSSRPWQLESLLLTEAPDDAVPVTMWLRRAAHARTWQLRHRLVREAGAVIRRIHEAACYFGDSRSARDALRVQVLPDGSQRVLLAAVEAIRQRHRPAARFALRDLTALWTAFGRISGRTDALRCLLTYLDVPRLTPEARRLVGRILGATPLLRHRARTVLRRGSA